MARVRTRFPTIFVGHPFGHRFPTSRFRRLFRELPFKVVYGNTDLQTEHLLRLMKANIRDCDYAVFDLSDWNANVSMELGLAEGLGGRAVKPYYILLNTNRSQDVPADVRGIQRLEYTRYDYRKPSGLGDALIHYILRKEYWVRKLWNEMPPGDKADKMLFLGLRIIAHLRDYERLTSENLQSLARGTRLRHDDR